MVQERSGEHETVQTEQQTLLSINTRCVFFNNLFEQIAVKSCSESSILFVRGSSSRYYSNAKKRTEHQIPSPVSEMKHIPGQRR